MAKDVEALYKQMDKATSDATEAKYDAQRYMMYCNLHYQFFLRNLPLKRKRKAFRAMIAKMRSTDRASRPPKCL